MTLVAVRWVPLALAAAGVCVALVRLARDADRPRGPLRPASISVLDPAAAADLEGGLADAWRACRWPKRADDAERMARVVLAESERQAYDPLFVQALIEIESTCDPRARSRRGALGLTQLRPRTARAMARELKMDWPGPAALYDPAINLRLGLHYLQKLERRFGDWHLAIAAYNLGPTRVARMDNGRARRSAYVQRIVGRYRELVEQRDR